MARAGVTREQVFEAADALIQEGSAPTVLAVRSRLGGGSPNTITPLLAEWKAQNETKPADNLPVLPASVEGAMRQVWSTAWRDARNLLEVEREALSAASKDIERERMEMLAEIERLDTELERAREEKKSDTAELDTERRAHDQTRAEVREGRAIADERGNRIEAQEVELREIRQQNQVAVAKVSRLESDLDHANKEIEQEKQRQAETQRQTGQLQKDLTQARIETDLLRAELMSAQEHAKEAKMVADATGKKLQRVEKSLAEERQLRTEAEKAAADLREEAATLIERAAHVDELRGLVHELQGQLALVSQAKTEERRTPAKRGKTK